MSKETYLHPPISLGMIISCYKSTKKLDVIPNQLDCIDILDPKDGHIRNLEWVLSKNPDLNDDSVGVVIGSYLAYLAKNKPELLNEHYMDLVKKLSSEIVSKYDNILEKHGFNFFN